MPLCEERRAQPDLSVRVVIRRRMTGLRIRAVLGLPGAPSGRSVIGGMGLSVTLFPIVTEFVSIGPLTSDESPVETSPTA